MGGSLLSETQLRRLHRHFGYPSAPKLISLLQNSRHSDDIDACTIQRLTQYCHICQKHSKSPYRFVFTLYNDTQQFNSRVVVYVFYLKNLAEPSRQRPVLYLLYEVTRYQVAVWLKDIPEINTWNSLRRAWIDIYLGSLEETKTDSGKRFTAKELKQLNCFTGITVNIVPVKSHAIFGVIKRYHDFLHRAYYIIQAEMPMLDKYTLLQAAINVVNDTAYPDGLVTTLLVYRTYRKITDSEPQHVTTGEGGKIL